VLERHPSHADLDRYRLDQLCDTDRRVVSNHLLWCRECRRTTLDAKELARLVAHLIGDAGTVKEYTETQQ
jgi:hypothetical protein